VVHSNAYLPLVPVEGRYRLGDDFDTLPTDFWWNTTHDDGTMVACAEPDGWEGVQFVTPIDTAGGRDGGLDGPQSIGPRVLPIQGAMVAADAATLRQKIRTLRAKLGPRKRVVWDQYDFGEGVRMGLVCRAQGDFRATPIMGTEMGGVATEVQFTLVAANPPWKYGTGAAEFIDIGLPVTTVSGRTYNKAYPYNYGDVTNPGGAGTATNHGDIESWPTFEITGPVDNPVITNETTDKAFLVSGIIPAGMTVTIDSRTGNVTPASYRLVGRPWSLVPGPNFIRWRASSGSFDPNANLRVLWRSTWE
jgi:tail protein